MVTLVFTWLVFFLAFNIINSAFFPWISWMPNFLHFKTNISGCPLEKCLGRYLRNVWTKNLHSFLLDTCFPFFSLSFYFPMCHGSVRCCSLVGDRRGYWSLPYLAWRKPSGLNIYRNSTQGKESSGPGDDLKSWNHLEGKRAIETKSMDWLIIHEVRRHFVNIL